MGYNNDYKESGVGIATVSGEAFGLGQLGEIAGEFKNRADMATIVELAQRVLVRKSRHGHCRKV